MFCLNHHCKFSNRVHQGPCITEPYKNESTTNVTNTYHSQTYVMNYVTVNNIYGDYKPQQNTKLLSNPFEAFPQLSDKK